METETERQGQRQTEAGLSKRHKRRVGGWRNKTERKTGGKNEGNTERQRDTEKQTDGFVSLFEGQEKEAAPRAKERRVSREVGAPGIEAPSKHHASLGRSAGWGRHSTVCPICRRLMVRMSQCFVTGDVLQRCGGRESLVGGVGLHGGRLSFLLHFK